jgi:hypothetical protein
MDDEEQMIDRVAVVIESYLSQLDDPGEVDSRDLAENIVLRLSKGDQ